MELKDKFSMKYSNIGYFAESVLSTEIIKIIFEASLEYFYRLLQNF